MEQTGQLKMLLTMFVHYLPMIFVCVIAGVVILTKWRLAPGAALWAALGFGLALALTVIMPVAQVLLQRWVFSGAQQQQRVWVFTVLGLASSMLHAVVYVLLLVAIFTGRASKTDPRPTEFGQT